jgi:hypothetical protein
MTVTIDRDILLFKITKTGEIERVKRGVYAIPGTVAKLAAKNTGEIGKKDRAVKRLSRKRRLDDIGFPIDAGGFSGACGKHHLQQRLQYLLQSFAAVLAGGLRIEAGYVAAAARSTLKFHGSS